MHKRYDIKVSGDGDLAGFLTKLVALKVKVLSLSVVDGVARFRTDRHGLKVIRSNRRRYRLKVNMSVAGIESGAKGIFTSNFFVIACIIPFVASLFLWTVEVESDRPEVVERIDGKLEKASIVPLRPLALIPDEGEIRRALMLDDPALSWVRFSRVGTTLTVIPMLSPLATQEEEVAGPPSDLIARTGGVITHFELKKGERVSHVHQTVKKGDVLATGVLVQGDKTTVVGADGAVYADYWVEYSFSLPKVIGYRLQGEETVEFSFNLPWQSQEEKWTPKSFIQTERHVQEETGQLELMEGMEETVLIPLLKNKLLSESLSKAIIQDEKVLHVSFDNDKVNGTILFLINDNIAVKRPISQGE
ncbi:sporulation protein YqfD [Sporosarcina sp. YIM B06819]|uniref:sporulation protein YqfD n=1 Tax=Sporosarcina sp. YIM B06819 TaxID=3081769 RepID=UPI00298CA603|nr:sporulation protein YqfD [Sporosarcina sp. YIM B06819]